MRPMRLDSLPPLSPLSHRINSWFDGLPSPASTRTTAASPAVLRPIENVQSTVPIKRAPEQSPRIGVDQENQILLPNKRLFDIAMDQGGVARDESPSKRPRYEDPETPTAPRLGSSVPSFPDPDRTPTASEKSYSDRTSSIASSHSRGRSPPKSPTRRADGERYDPRIEYPSLAEMTNEDLEFPKRILAAGTRFPGSLQEGIQAHPSERMRIGRVQWDAPEISRAKLNQLWQFSGKIFDESAECDRLEEDEQGWSDNVVLKLLDFAISWGGFEDKIKRQSLQTTKMNEKTLLPAMDGKPVPKQVDFGLSPIPTDIERDKIRGLLSRMNTISIGQSDVPKLRYHALFSNLEIKRTYQGQDPAPQLGIWSAAGLKKMASFVSAKAHGVAPSAGLSDQFTIPSIPCWIVEGANWKFHMAKHCGTSLVQMQGDIFSFSTRHISDIVSIIYCLVVLLVWGDDHYRKWIAAC